MKNFSIISKSTMTLNDNFWFRVHAAGCRDIKHDDVKYGGGHFNVAASSALEAVNEEVEQLLSEHGEDSGWSNEMFQILPCADKI